MAPWRTCYTSCCRGMRRSQGCRGQQLRLKRASPVQDRHSPATVTSRSRLGVRKPAPAVSQPPSAERGTVINFAQFPWQRRLHGAARDELDWLLRAIGFLTVVSMPPSRLSGSSYGRAVGYFPLVGLLIGSFVAGFDAMAGRLLPGPVTGVLDLALLALITGGLHLDGLMDTCDGLFGGHDRERRLAIMRDSRLGSYGALCGILVLLLDYAALLGLAGSGRAAVLILAPVLGRWAMVVVMLAFPYARAEGKGTVFKRGLGWRQLARAGAWTMAVAALGFSPLWLPVAAALAALLAGRWIASRLGGLTGDNYGAICELVTALTFVGCSSRLF